MARKGAKRASSAGVSKRESNAVAKKCKTIASTIRHTEGVPQPVRSLVNDRMLQQVFGTYKEDRIPFQTTMSELVGNAIKTAEQYLGGKIHEAQASKAAQEAEAANLTATSNNAQAASDAAAAAAADAKNALDASHAAHKAAKAALHDLENATKTAEVDGANATANKEKLESLVRDLFTPVREGTLAKGLAKAASSAGTFLSNKTDLQKEFVVCVERTFTKASSTWGTFDKIVDQKLNEKLQGVLAGLERELASMEAAKGTRATNVENATAAIAAGEEHAKAAEEASNNAANVAKEAAKAAKAAAANAEKQQNIVDKASETLEEAQEALAAFQKSAVAAYTEIEALAPPPPAPEQPEEAAAPAASPAKAAKAAAPSIDQAMTVAPREQKPAAQTYGLSPGVLFQQAAGAAARAVGLSPRVSQSPR